MSCKQFWFYSILTAVCVYLSGLLELLLQGVPGGLYTLRLEGHAGGLGLLQTPGLVLELLLKLHNAGPQATLIHTQSANHTPTHLDHSWCSPWSIQEWQNMWITMCFWWYCMQEWSCKFKFYIHFMLTEHIFKKSELEKFFKKCIILAYFKHFSTQEPRYNAMLQYHMMQQHCKWGSIVRYFRSRYFPVLLPVYLAPKLRVYEHYDDNDNDFICHKE